MNSTASKTAKTRSSGPRLSAGGVDQLADALRAGRYGAFEAKSPVAACLFPLLRTLEWRGNLRELFEAMPHFANSLGIGDLRNILATLGYSTHERTIKNVDSIDERLLPCLIITADDKPYVLYGKTSSGFKAYGGSEADKIELTTVVGPIAAYFITQTHRDVGNAQAKAGESWFMSVVRRFNKTIWRLLLVTFFINVLALALPIYIMTLYDQVIPLQAKDVLLGLSIGVGSALFFDGLLRLLRSRLIAMMAARIEHIVGTTTFRKILSLPPSMTESALLGDQVAKVRDFDSLRDIFSSLLVTVGLDLPFVIVFLVVLTFLAGSLVFVPLAMILFYFIIWMLLVPPLRRAVKEASTVKARRHSFLVEAITNMRTIKEAAVEHVWSQRHRELSATAALMHHKSSQISFLFQTLGQTVMMGSGLAALAYGVYMAMAGDITMGALIASMALTWKILSPAQNLFLTFARAEQTRVAINQVDSLMQLKEEKRADRQASGVERAWQGGISLVRVSLRYSPTSEPALLGVNLSINPGEFLAISGNNGSGKSSILRVVLGLHKPQGGQVRLDGVDVRQIATNELRTAIAYVPQQPSLFHGTIAQNLRLGNPVASDSDLRQACEMAGVWDDIQELDDKLNTRVGDQNIWQMNSGLRQRLALARAYTADSPVLILDEPAHALDDKGDQALMRALSQLRGKQTIIMVSHRPSHLRLADKLVELDRGAVVKMGTPEQVLASGGG